jgi:hypothetical protein
LYKFGIVHIKGGLGNQLFQYFFSKYLESFGVIVFFDLSFFEREKNYEFYTERIFHLNNIFKTNIKDFRKLIPFYNTLKRYKNLCLSDFNYVTDETFNPYMFHTFCIYDGYWQSEQFLFKSNFFQSTHFQKCLSYNFNLLKRFKHLPNVAIHFRRGDYISNPKNAEVHSLCSNEYYYSAIKLINSYIGQFRILIFSDDIDWVKNNFYFPEPFFFISKDLKFSDWEEMLLFSKCDHYIISNSTFSWWGAMLSPKKNSIKIAPKKWFNDSQKNMQYTSSILSSFISI